MYTLGFKQLSLHLEILWNGFGFGQYIYTLGFKQLSLHLEILWNGFGVLRVASCHNSQGVSQAGI